jgi:hypothetical protein
MTAADEVLARIAVLIEAPGLVDSPPMAPECRPEGETGPVGVEGPAEPAVPRVWGYSVERMNERYALVLMGAQAVIFVENPGAPLDDQQRFIKIEAFNVWHANKWTEVLSPGGDVKAITWSKAWLTSRERRQYSGVEFFPDPNNAVGTAGYLNLWSGFVYQPRAKKNGYATFRDHLLNNVCAGDEKRFRWVFAFFADIVQNPRSKPGVAIVLRGRMGTGKTKVGELIGALFPRHYFLVDDPRYVTGNFNAHMASCLLLQADEAVWAGDKAAEGRLKSLVTSPIQQIEAKGIDPIRLKNHLRVVMTSNEDWVVPAGKDERRFAVFDVDPRCAQNTDYFREMDEEMADGGYEALLHDLLAFDLSQVNLRQIPKTDALLEQKLRSLDSVDRWLFEVLERGTTTRLGDDWLDEVATATLVDDYLEQAERVGIKRKAEETLFAAKVRKIIPGIERFRGWATMKDTVRRRVWMWRMPPLADCRAAFEAAMQQPIAWPDYDGDGSDYDERRDDALGA